MKKITRDFYLRKNVVKVAQDLLGTFLVTEFEPSIITIGKIVETEAYQGPFDKASHSYNLRRTQRTETMYLEGGVAYIYLCYGIHHLFNIVTGPKDTPHGVLIRAIEPVEGIEIMLQRRQFEKIKHTLAAGPGAMSKAMGITTAYNSENLQGKRIWVTEREEILKPKDIIASPRVGVAYAEDHALLPWRFRIKGNPWTSRAK